MKSLIRCADCTHQRPNHGLGVPIPAGFTACAKARVYESFSPTFERQCADYVVRVVA